jgi:polyhydroxyalkanoate synthase
MPEQYQNYYAKIKRAADVLTKDAEPEVGPTPKEVIWTKNKATLYRYTSEQPKNIRFLFLWFMH